MGETELAIWKRQFAALRDGDRFFYANYPALDKISQYFGISYKHSLAEIIALNTDVEPGDLHVNEFKLSSPPFPGLPAHSTGTSTTASNDNAATLEIAGAGTGSRRLKMAA